MGTNANSASQQQGILRGQAPGWLRGATSPVSASKRSPEAATSQPRRGWAEIVIGNSACGDGLSDSFDSFGGGRVGALEVGEP